MNLPSASYGVSWDIIMKDIFMAIFKSLLKNHVYTVRYGIAKGLKVRGGFGFLPSVVINTSLEEEFLMGLDLRGHTVYDIGGYWGAFTIFFAKAVGRTGRVVTFEPNPQNFNRIL